MMANPVVRNWPEDSTDRKRRVDKGRCQNRAGMGFAIAARTETDWDRRIEVPACIDIEVENNVDNNRFVALETG